MKTDRIPVQQKDDRKSNLRKWIQVLFGLSLFVTVFLLAMDSITRNLTHVMGKPAHNGTGYVLGNIPQTYPNGPAKMNGSFKGAKDRIGKRRLCFRFMGRLGNQLFQFAALIGISRSKDMIPVIQKSNRLYKLFELEGITSLSYNLCRHVKVHRDKRSCAFDQQSVTFSNTKDIGLFGFFQSWRYFAKSAHEVRKLLTIKPNVLATARKTLTRFIHDQHGVTSGNGSTLVGVHIRRGDIAGAGYNHKHGYVVSSVEYLNNAMAFYRNIYRKIIFVICSDSKLWPFLHLPHNDTVFVSGQTAEADMAILSLCDHSIITVGSYGWWAAWLANGTTVYSKHQYRPGSRLEQQFNLSDYFPPQWVAL